LRRILTAAGQHEKAIGMFLDQHAMLHSAKMAGSAPWSFEDAILDDMSEAQIRRIPRNAEHSIAWCLWHIARIEDVAMNLLVAGRAQVFSQSEWPERMRVSIQDTGNAMSPFDVAHLSEKIDIQALRAYRVAVGRRTREIVKGLAPEDLKRKVNPSRLQQVMDQGAVVPAARGVVDYWSKRDVAGLLLMPASRHCLVHLNEALQLKGKRQTE
jgi:hypothetical protein